MIAADIILNLVIFLATLIILARLPRKDGEWVPDRLRENHGQMSEGHGKDLQKASAEEGHAEEGYVQITGRQSRESPERKKDRRILRGTRKREGTGNGDL